MRLGRLIAFVTLVCAAVFAAAHPASLASATLKVDEHGHFEARVRFDLIPFLLNQLPRTIDDGPMNELLDSPFNVLTDSIQDGKKRFQDGLRIETEAGSASIETTLFPSASELVTWRESNFKPRFPVMLTTLVKGTLPPSAHQVWIKLPEVMGSVVVTAEFPYHEAISEAVEPGQLSSKYSIPTSAELARLKAEFNAPRFPSTITHPTAPAASSQIKSKSAVATSLAVPVSAPRVPTTPNAAEKQPVKVQPVASPSPGVPPVASVVPPGVAESRPNPLRNIPGFIRMGFHHIMPEGVDHILFVLGLFLLTPRVAKGQREEGAPEPWFDRYQLKPLLSQITAFTIAHSLTLGLSLYGVVQLPSRIVEPIIAISIAFVAIENIAVSELRAWRPAVVFLFGLIHGLGFAGALKDLGLAKQDFLSSLVGFNVGVELGQLSVVALAFLAVGWFRSDRRYRQWILVPGSLAIAGIALFWTVQRVLA